MARFRARARAVDMLGRQQIAGVPTAISELFKNAHDAYADRVEVDFFRPDNLLVLRDDGVGMDRSDFENRWLTLGTESKLASVAGVGPPPTDPSKKLRPVLGEKGIGRLAIAAIGPQVLVLTRPKHATGQPQQELVAALIHWGVFQLPGVNLDQIQIPVQTFPGGTLPTRSDVASMGAVIRANLDAIAHNSDPQFLKVVCDQIAAFAVDPPTLDALLCAPSVAGDDGHGTHFYIQPTDESLAAAIDSRADDDIAPLIKTLVGFTNTMTPNHPEAPIRPAFRDHKSGDLTDDLISESEFFTPEEFRNADHHIEGSFDDFGQFAGTVTVYAEPTADHLVPWPSARGAKTECGPFKINVAVVQGLSSQSTLPPSEWAGMSRKLNRIGGLYIYRDGIRVLPYGNNDYDFLDIERNRTKSASDYYFSYRRIFGVVELTRECNHALVEKAGREGFLENRAFRQFREILKNFFVQIAADFFREGGTHAELYRERRGEIDRLERARRKREKLVTSKRNAFRARLDRAMADVRDSGPGDKSSAIVAEFERDLAAVATLNDPDRAVFAFIESELRVRRALADLKESYRVVPPRGVGLPPTVRQDLVFYREQYDHLGPSVFEPAEARVEALLSEAAERSRVAIDRRVRFDKAMTAITTEARRAAQSVSNQARAAANDLQGRVVAMARESLGDIDRVVQDVLTRAARLDVSHLEANEFVTLRTRLEDEVIYVSHAARRLLNGVVVQLEGVAVPSVDARVEDGDGTALDVTEALEDEVIALRERAEADLELAQLGMAITVINHEFDNSIKAVRTSLRELRAWADANEELRRVYTKIRRSFDHLDGYLTLFTPLQRRLYRNKVSFRGAEIVKFLSDLFQERLVRDGAAIEATSAFRHHKLTGYPSSFYPVFVNLVDNALYWLESSPRPRRISFDAIDGRIIVANSGPPIDDNDAERIFKQGFTRKPRGTGLGLYLARQALAREGYSIRMAAAPAGMRAAFVIEANALAQNRDEVAVDSRLEGSDAGETGVP